MVIRLRGKKLDLDVDKSASSGRTTALISIVIVQVYTSLHPHLYQPELSLKKIILVVLTGQSSFGLHIPDV